MIRNKTKNDSSTKHKKQRVKTNSIKSRRTRPQDPTTKFYGVQACRAIFQHRRNDISRIFLLPELAASFNDLLEWGTRRGIQHKIVEYEELSRIAATEHHEGICCEARSLEPLPLAKFLSRLDGTAEGCVLILEGVENPHNVGAIMRTGCFFGVSGVVLVSQQMRTLSGASCRVAEGAAERTPVAVVRESGQVFQALQKRGYSLIATTPHQAESMYSVSWPRKVALIFGSEGLGLSPEVLETADKRVAIPRYGPLESLNVGAAVASVLTEVRHAWLGAVHRIKR